jgi:hypothetical protein
MIRRAKPRPFLIARLMLLALVAHLGLAAVCDARCAVPAERAPASSTVNAHATHCQSPAAPGARARAGHHVAPCQHEAELSARASESRPSGRHDLALVSYSAVSMPPPARHVVRGAPAAALVPLPPRSARPLVLRI